MPRRGALCRTSRGGQPPRPLFHGMERVRRFHIAVLDASAEDRGLFGGVKALVGPRCGNRIQEGYWDVASLTSDRRQPGPFCASLR